MEMGRKRQTNTGRGHKPAENGEASSRWPGRPGAQGIRVTVSTHTHTVSHTDTRMQRLKNEQSIVTRLQQNKSNDACRDESDPTKVIWNSPSDDSGVRNSARQKHQLRMCHDPNVCLGNVYHKRETHRQAHIRTHTFDTHTRSSKIVGTCARTDP